MSRRASGLTRCTSLHRAGGIGSEQGEQLSTGHAHAHETHEARQPRISPRRSLPRTNRHQRADAGGWICRGARRDDRVTCGFALLASRTFLTAPVLTAFGDSLASRLDIGVLARYGIECRTELEQGTGRAVGWNTSASRGFFRRRCRITANLIPALHDSEYGRPRCTAERDTSWCSSRPVGRELTTRPPKRVVTSGFSSRRRRPRRAGRD